MHFLSKWTVLGLMGLALAACSTPNAEVGAKLPDEDPSITGTITRIEPARGAGQAGGALPAGDPDQPVSSDDPPAAGGTRRGILGTVLIEENPNEPSGSDKASTTVNKDTRILKQDGEKVVNAAFDDLKGGQRAQVWFTGPVAESYPVQATAGVILILEAQQ